MRLLSGENHTDDLARAFEQCLALVDLFCDGNSGYAMILKSIVWWMFCLAGICLGSSELQAQTCGNGYPCGPDGAPLLQMLTPQGFMGADFRGSIVIYSSGMNCIAGVTALRFLSDAA